MTTQTVLGFAGQDMTGVVTSSHFLRRLDSFASVCDRRPSQKGMIGKVLVGTAATTVTN